MKGGALISSLRPDEKDNIVLFPKTLDYYQIELTRMLETERYGEAVELLQFLLQCQGEDPRHYEEWQALLDWLIGAFPALKNGMTDSQGLEDEDETEEMLARRLAEAKLAEDAGYADKLLHTVRDKPLSEQTFLALEQLAYLDRPEVDDALIGWITREELHPLLQYRVLQTLRRSGTTGTLVFTRGGERVEVEIEAVPLKPEDFPPAVQSVLDRVGDLTQVHDPTLFYFAQELWSQFVMALYGTVDYRSLLSEEDSVIDIWAAALHQMVADSLSGSQTDEEIRAMYGITDGLRLRYEQICRLLGKFVASGRLRGM
ncbi:MAG: hypothetical protein E7211_19290 [Clostridium lundense]|uniref:hypothetical protein n=1 Tax=Paenibacillus sp. J53TS2 TaxID=2807197 RepID=UPI001BD108C1|nr:hypothetical protein [Paenibacillus sp. J53TS2]MBE6069813.1 hypothetical protein [Clostridium lundense]